MRNGATTLHRTLKDATRKRLMPRNPADDADAPKVRRQEMRVRSPEQVRSFLDHVRGDRLYCPWLLAAAAGMRRGELLSLAWRDVNLERGQLQVRAPGSSSTTRCRSARPKRTAGAG
jgi:integrase